MTDYILPSGRIKMNFQLETTDVAIARSFSRAVTFRDSFELNQETDYLNNYKVSGSGVSMSGREIQFAAKFQDGNGCAVLVIYAPDSRGGILETVLQDIFPEHQGSRGLRKSWYTQAILTPIMPGLSSPVTRKLEDRGGKLHKKSKHLPR